MGVQLTENVASTLVDQYAPIRDDLAAARRIFDDELVSDLPQINRLCERIRSYRGKMIRPALLLLTGKAIGPLTAAHHTLAAVIEMVHMATLVHDDVLDEADRRRGLPTIRATDGNVAAVLFGDCLISHAFHLCSTLDSQYASRRIGATTNTVCEGELLQNHLRGGDPIDESYYFEIVRRKTGALTAVACELGAHFAGASESTTSGMYAFGMSAGVAFQIVDDVLDIVGDCDRVGKTLGLDLASGKLTLPAIHCLSESDPATVQALGEMLAGRTSYDHDRVRGWLDESGSVEYSKSVAVEFVDGAMRRLDLIPPGEARDALVALAGFITDRHF